MKYCLAILVLIQSLLFAEKPVKMAISTGFDSKDAHELLQEALSSYVYYKLSALIFQNENVISATSTTRSYQSLDSSECTANYLGKFKISSDHQDEHLFSSAIHCLYALQTKYFENYTKFLKNCDIKKNKDQFFSLTCKENSKSRLVINLVGNQHFIKEKMPKLQNELSEYQKYEIGQIFVSPKNLYLLKEANGYEDLKLKYPSRKEYDFLDEDLFFFSIVYKKADSQLARNIFLKTIPRVKIRRKLSSQKTKVWKRENYIIANKSKDEIGDFDYSKDVIIAGFGHVNEVFADSDKVDCKANIHSCLKIERNKLGQLNIAVTTVNEINFKEDLQKIISHSSNEGVSKVSILGGDSGGAVLAQFENEKNQKQVKMIAVNSSSTYANIDEKETINSFQILYNPFNEELNHFVDGVMNLLEVVEEGQTPDPALEPKSTPL